MIVSVIYQIYYTNYHKEFTMRYMLLGTNSELDLKEKIEDYTVETHINHGSRLYTLLNSQKGIARPWLNSSWRSAIPVSPYGIKAIQALIDPTFTLNFSSNSILIKYNGIIDIYIIYSNERNFGNGPTYFLERSKVNTISASRQYAGFNGQSVPVIYDDGHVFYGFKFKNPITCNIEYMNYNLVKNLYY